MGFAPRCEVAGLKPLVPRSLAQQPVCSCASLVNSSLPNQCYKWWHIPTAGTSLLLVQGPSLQVAVRIPSNGTIRQAEESL